MAYRIQVLDNPTTQNPEMAIRKDTFLYIDMQVYIYFTYMPACGVACNQNKFKVVLISW